VTHSRYSVDKIFGDNLQAARLRRGWSMRELRERSGVAITQISGAERGKPIKLSTAKRLADGLGIPLATMIEDQGEAAHAQAGENPSVQA
jgi:transcriptional regulator with XRE-family HTH domain